MKRRLKRGSAGTKTRPMTIAHIRPSAWLSGRMDDITTRLASGAGPRCEHLRDGRARTVLATLWSEALACAGCSQRLRPAGDAERTCDRCGALATPLVHPVLIQPTATWFIFCGRCTGCRDREVAR